MITAFAPKTFPQIWREGFLNIETFAREILEVDVHPGQVECFQKARLKRNVFLDTGNRWGKGEWVAIYGAWMCAYKPVEKQFKSKKLKALNTSITQDQANIIFDKFNELCTEKPKFSWLIDDIKQSPFPHIVFNNGVTWWFRNGSSDGKFLEGHSFFYTNTDEADLFPNLPHFQEEILDPRTWDYAGFRTITTTPRRGKRNAYKLFLKMKNAMDAGSEQDFAYQGDSRVNKFLSREAITQMNTLPKRLFNKNVLGHWEDEGEVFPSELLDSLERIAIGLQSEPQPGGLYINAWDLARSKTWCVRVTVKIGEVLQVVSYERFKDRQNSPSPEYWKLVEQRIKAANSKWKGTTIIDKTGIGDVMFSYIQDVAPIGVVFSSKNEEEMIATASGVMQRAKVGLPKIEQREDDGSMWIAQDELRDFEQDSKQRGQWDFVCALFMAIACAHGMFIEKKQTPQMPSRIKGVSKYAR